MFEKESEEYVRKIRHDVINWGGTEPEERFYNEIKFKQAYLAGAEFGYNKANEWHYVKDGEYPTHSNRVLVFTDEGVGFGIYGLDNKKWYTYDTGFDVIAWKEITPPKEIKENEN